MGAFKGFSDAALALINDCIRGNSLADLRRGLEALTADERDEVAATLSGRAVNVRTKANDLIVEAERLDKIAAQVRRLSREMGA